MKVDRQPLGTKVWLFPGIALVASTVAWLPAPAKHSLKVFLGEDAASAANRAGSDESSNEESSDDEGAKVVYPALLDPERRLMMTQQYVRYQHYRMLIKKAGQKAGKSGRRSEWEAELHSSRTAYNHVADMADPSAFDAFPYPHHLDNP